ncbi:MAG: CDP-glycerol glycerophosphotransferase family protein [Gammaproteobacteria bacterium]|nr:CDP-glycerol glycerophosphotransferase family protein [Gammaproteobacteria bacterium]
MWVFGSWGGYRFADNAAAFFLFCHKQIGDRVRLVWISRSKDIIEDVRERGYEAHWLWSLRGLCCCLRAKFYLFDSFSKDVNYWPSRQAIKINLWSGVPLKTFERDIDNPRSRYFRLFHGSLPERWFLGMMMPWHVDRPDLLIATSDETREITWKAFDVTSDSVVVTGLPRNDILFARSRAAGKAQRAWPDSFSAAVDAKRFIFFYLPTYRDSGKAFLNIAWEEVDSLMCHLGATFFFKFHPDDKGRFEGELENVVQLPQKIDIYEMLAYADALVSDYSSIIFDYMLLDRPIIYYVPDLDDFVASSRSLYFHPADIAVGPMCTTTSELMTSLIEAAERRKMPETVRAQWDEKRRRFNTHHDGESSRRTLEAIKERYFFGNI